MSRSGLLGLMSLAAAACAGNDGQDFGELHDVACSIEYLTVTHAADGSSTTETEIRAELDSNVDHTELWRVSAVACDLTQSPPPAGCMPNQDCAPRPLSACTNVFAGIAAGGKLLAICGHRTEQRNAAGAVTSSAERTYRTVTFRVQ